MLASAPQQSSPSSGIAVIESKPKSVTVDSPAWLPILSAEIWERVDLERSCESLFIKGYIRGPIERNSKSIIVRIKFYSNNGEEIAYKPVTWSHSVAAGTYRYLARWHVNGCFYLNIDSPPTAAYILLSFQRWNSQDSSTYSVRIDSVRRGAVDKSRLLQGEFKGTNPATLIARVESLQEFIDDQRQTIIGLEASLKTKSAEAGSRIKQHLSYRLGKEIVESRLSPLAWATLPQRLILAYKRFRLDVNTPVDSQVHSGDSLAAIYRRSGTEGLIRHITGDHSDPLSKQTAERLLCALDVVREQGGQESEPALLEQLARVDQSLSLLRERFWKEVQASNIYGALRTAKQLEYIVDNYSLGPNAYKDLRKILSHPANTLAFLQSAQRQEKVRLEPVRGRLCYFLHNSLPYASGGYATRAHGLSRGLTEAGWEVIAYTRPGFPADTVAELAEGEVPAEAIIDGVTYRRIASPSRKDYKALRYLSLAIDAVEAELLAQKPEAVVAASNYITALPVLIAARQLGIPFYYEIRGFWEITRLSREPQYKKEFSYSLSEAMEAGIAARADGVFTLTQAMKEELVRRKVADHHVYILPNCCDSETFCPRDKDLTLQRELGIPDGVPVIGYVGTFVGYEGLEDLAIACGMLKRRGIAFRLLLVGNENVSGSERGAIWQAIEAQARRDDYLDWLILPGRVPHELVPNYYSLIDIAPFPRKPQPVTEMVSPMKPLEAMAMEKAVVVSSVRALQEIVAHEETGLVFSKGDAVALSDALERLAEDPALRRELAAHARRWVVGERSWNIAGKYMTQVLRAPAHAATE